MTLFQKARLQEKEFPLKIDVLNYSPVAYLFPKAWVEFLGSIEGRMKQTLDQTSPDDLNDDMFDAMIEAAAQEARTSAHRQREDHLYVIRHDRNVLLGELAEVQTLRNDLVSALDEITQQLAATCTTTRNRRKKEE